MKALQPKLVAIIALVMILTITGCAGRGTSTEAGEELETKLSTLCWVAYAPTHFNPDAGLFPSESEVREDLRVLYAAGVRGLVTYGSDNIGGEIPRITREAGFQGMIMGIWSPTSDEELNNARQAVEYIDGYVVGNEGLDKLYDYDTLKNAMDDLRKATSKPVATTEEIDDYYQDPRLRELGDWLFPNVHPYWHGKKEPSQAVQWTVEQFQRLSEYGKAISFKEVGLPTGGDPEVSEARQAEYYRLLHNTSVHFVYFEAFDGPWKTWAPVEPYWGLFRSDRSAKEVVNYVCSQKKGEQGMASLITFVAALVLVILGILFVLVVVLSGVMRRGDTEPGPVVSMGQVIFGFFGVLLVALGIGLFWTLVPTLPGHPPSTTAVWPTPTQVVVVPSVTPTQMPTAMPTSTPPAPTVAPSTSTPPAPTIALPTSTPSASTPVSPAPTAAPSPTPSPMAPTTPTATPIPKPTPVVITLTYEDFSLEKVCTYENPICPWIVPGKAIIYGWMTKEIEIPPGKSKLDVTISIPCNGWGEGLAGRDGSAAHIIVEDQVKEEKMDSSMNFHHNRYYRYEYCDSFTNTFDVGGKSRVTLTIKMFNGAQLDFYSATLEFY